ncbi:TonB-dependent receptor plug domain-containing protein [Leptolyngbya sp. 15MV]|nr:TonB-dependent receptor plug domain-containing protein [Leptolyngbya sp. 15MV]
MDRFSYGRTRLLVRVSASAVCATALLIAPAVSAQDLTGPSPEQGEAVRGNIIVVTARKQEETLQEVPVAVSVISAATLESSRIDEAADIVGRVPSLNVQIGGSGASAQISLRGVGSSNISNAFDSAVALNYDGVAISTQRLLQSAFFDVSQVEVLKGPQSLYFGKAASAGVLSLRSADPTPDWQVGGRASYEFEEHGYTIGGYISGPLSDTLGVRLAGEYQDIAKYVQLQRDVPARDRDKGLTNFIGRVTLDWQPTSTFNANLKLNYNRQRGESLLQFTDIFCGGDGLPDPSVLAVFGVSFAPTHDCNIRDSRFPTPDGNAAIDTVPTGTVGADRADISQPFNDTDLFFGRLSPRRRGSQPRPRHPVRRPRAPDAHPPRRAAGWARRQRRGRDHRLRRLGLAQEHHRREHRTGRHPRRHQPRTGHRLAAGPRQRLGRPLAPKRRHRFAPRQRQVQDLSRAPRTSDPPRSQQRRRFLPPGTGPPTRPPPRRRVDGRGPARGPPHSPPRRRRPGLPHPCRGPPGRGLRRQRLATPRATAGARRARSPRPRRRTRFGSAALGPRRPAPP